MRELTYVQAIGEALSEEMRRDNNVFLIGESIQGASFGITAGMVQEFGDDRVMDTPIAETGIVGAALGSSMMGYRPVVDIMFADFMYVAGDEIFLKASQWHFLHGGKVKVPVVIFAAVGGGMMLANEHSQVPTGKILNTPGLKLVLPSTPYEAKGLMKTAVRDNNPVIFFWHKALMATSGEVPEGEYTIPFGVADIKREGSEVTVVASAMMVHHALQAAKELEGKIDVEVIDPRTLEPLDMDTILASVEKTGRLVIVDEDRERCGFGGELGFQVMEKAFESLDAPIKRICTPNYPIPGGYIESHILPNPAKVKAAIEEVMN
jgi:acetoin:2,6-dichlorophenolindophenol oxidoreductase subunit beta